MFPVKLSNSPLLAYVDSCDAIAVSQFTWRLDKNGYVRCETGPKKNRKTLYLHRFIMLGQRQSKKVVDHIHQNKLDCRRSELRFLDQSANGFANIQRFPRSYPALHPDQKILEQPLTTNPPGGQESFSPEETQVTYNQILRGFWSSIEEMFPVRED